MWFRAYRGSAGLTVGPDDLKDLSLPTLPILTFYEWRARPTAGDPPGIAALPRPGPAGTRPRPAATPGPAWPGHSAPSYLARPRSAAARTALGPRSALPLQRHRQSSARGEPAQLSPTPARPWPRPRPRSRPAPRSRASTARSARAHPAAAPAPPSLRGGPGAPRASRPLRERLEWLERPRPAPQRQHSPTEATPPHRDCTVPQRQPRETAPPRRDHTVPQRPPRPTETAESHRDSAAP